MANKCVKVKNCDDISKYQKCSERGCYVVAVSHQTAEVSPSNSSGLLSGLSELRTTLTICAKAPITKDFSFRDMKRHERYARIVEKAINFIENTAT